MAEPRKSRAASHTCGPGSAPDSSPRTANAMPAQPTKSPMTWRAPSSPARGRRARPRAAVASRSARRRNRSPRTPAPPWRAPGTRRRATPRPPARPHGPVGRGALCPARPRPVSRAANRAGAAASARRAAKTSAGVAQRQLDEVNAGSRPGRAPWRTGVERRRRAGVGHRPSNPRRRRRPTRLSRLAEGRVRSGLQVASSGARPPLRRGTAGSCPGGQPADHCCSSANSPARRRGVLADPLRCRTVPTVEA